jgi:serine/threonine protein kinase
MSLAPGAQIGPYEVVSMIGAGGMGEVYRASDSNLKRLISSSFLIGAERRNHLVDGEPDGVSFGEHTRHEAAQSVSRSPGA